MVADARANALCGGTGVGVCADSRGELVGSARQRANPPRIGRGDCGIVLTLGDNRNFFADGSYHRQRIALDA